MNTATVTASSIYGQIYLRDQPSYTSPQWSRVVLVAKYSRWQIQAITKILGLLSLPNDWDSYGSPPPTEIAATSAIQLVTDINLDYFLSPRVVPVPGGGVQLEWSFGPREVEIEIDDDGSVEYLKTEKGNPIEEKQISLADFPVIRSLLLWVTAHKTEKD